MNVMRCILSFSASPSSVCIHPWSLLIRLSEWRCLIMAAANPGTPATVSSRMQRERTADSSRAGREPS